MARSVQTQPSWRPFVNGPHPPVSNIYSSSLACATTIASMWTISHVLLPPCWTFFGKVRFGIGLLSSSLHLTAIKTALISSPVLHIPVLGEPFVVRMDASDTQLGAVLEQSGQLVAYFFAKNVSHRVQLPSD